MFASLAILALAGSAAVQAAPVAKRDVPSTYAEGYLEPYATYHERYAAIDCMSQHDTPFFEACCHPLLATETLAADRPAYCAPNATQNATEAANNGSLWNATSADVGEVYNATSSSVSASYAQASSTIGQAAIQTKEAQQTSTSEWTAPSSTYVAPSSTSSSSAPAQTSSSSSGGQEFTGGDATYFTQNGVAGSCGTVHSDSDYVIAIDSNFGGYNAYCGKQIRVTNTNNGKSVVATVADTCPTCNNADSLDLSVGAFQAIAAESDGMVPISWSWA